MNPSDLKRITAALKQVGIRVTKTWVWDGAIYDSAGIWGDTPVRIRTTTFSGNGFALILPADTEIPAALATYDESNDRGWRIDLI